MDGILLIQHLHRYFKTKRPTASASAAATNLIDNRQN
jgi:hypothetical protein